MDEALTAKLFLWVEYHEMASLMRIRIPLKSKPPINRMNTDVSQLARLLRSKDPRVQVVGGAIAIFALLPSVLSPLESPQLDKWARVAQNVAWIGITLTALAIKPDEGTPSADETRPPSS